MKIEQIEAIPCRIPLTPERRMVSALGRHEVSDFVLVRLRTDTGAEGVGEATVTPRWSGETAWSVEALITRLFGPALHGVEVADLAEINRRMDALAVYNWFAKSAIEMACWDVLGRDRGQPVFELLGGAKRPLEVVNRFSMGAYDVERASRRAGELVEQGFRTIKVKVGGVVDEDVARVEAVRAAAGDEILLTVDANGGWSLTQALEAIPRLQSLNVTLFEQPLQRGDYTRLAQLRNETGCRILADESCFNFIECEELIAHRCCDALTVYPGKHGGLGRAAAITARAGEAGLPCTIGSNLEWDVGAAAMLHFIVATENVRIEELPGDCLGPSYHELSIATNPIVISGPVSVCPSGPGLGVDVDWGQVEAIRLTRD
ncbi:MAG: muconate cycloisomerase [Planctomycetales bacterium]|nr:muconate cycloisomerase [Planctomycetales bacterium]